MLISYFALLLFFSSKRFVRTRSDAIATKTKSDVNYDNDGER